MGRADGRGRGLSGPPAQQVRADGRGRDLPAAALRGTSEVLLVGNQRRNGTVDWTTPGGVIEVNGGESMLDGLAREVLEETGLTVESWHPHRLYEVQANAAELGWRLRVEVYLATAWNGTLSLQDPDEIVVAADFLSIDEAFERLETSHPWVREPFTQWLQHREAAPTRFEYRIDGTDAASMTVTRVE